MIGISTIIGMLFLLNQNKSPDSHTFYILLVSNWYHFLVSLYFSPESLNYLNIDTTSDVDTKGFGVSSFIYEL